MDPVKRDRGLAGPSTQDASVSGQVLAYGVGLVVFVLRRAVERRLGILNRIAPRARRGLAWSYGRMGADLLTPAGVSSSVRIRGEQLGRGARGRRRDRAS